MSVQDISVGSNLLLRAHQPDRDSGGQAILPLGEHNTDGALILRVRCLTR